MSRELETKHVSDRLGLGPSQETTSRRTKRDTEKRQIFEVWLLNNLQQMQKSRQKILRFRADAYKYQRWNVDCDKREVELGRLNRWYSLSFCGEGWNCDLTNSWTALRLLMLNPTLTTQAAYSLRDGLVNWSWREEGGMRRSSKLGRGREVRYGTVGKLKSPVWAWLTGMGQELHAEWQSAKSIGLASR